MHVHNAPLNPAGSALVHAQAVETATALRRAKELRDTASHLKALSINVGGDQSIDPQTVAMVSAWSGQNNPSHPPPAQPENSEDPALKPAQPVSFWA